MTPLFYLAPRRTVIEHHQSLPEFHMVWADPSKQTEDDLVVAKIHFDSDGHEEWWASHAGVERLPHPVLESSTPISDDHANKLKMHGAKKGHTIHDLIRSISGDGYGKSPAMRIRVV